MLESGQYVSAVPNKTGLDFQGASRESGDDSNETDNVVLACCRCAERRWGLTIEHVACKPLLYLKGTRRPLVPNKDRLSDVRCVFFRDHLMHASELMLRAAERGVDEWTDCMPASVRPRLACCVNCCLCYPNACCAPRPAISPICMLLLFCPRLIASWGDLHGTSGYEIAENDMRGAKTVNRWHKRYHDISFDYGIVTNQCSTSCIVIVVGFLPMMSFKLFPCQFRLCYM
jgi:hypothetical protein